MSDVQQIFTKKMQFHYQMQLHLPDVQQNFAVIGQQRRTDRITNGENVLYLDVRRCKWWCEWTLTCYKRIIRENDAKKLETYSLQKNNQRKRCKEDFLIQQNRSCKLLVTEKADIQILNILKEIKIWWTFYSVSKIRKHFRKKTPIILKPINYL